MRRIAAACAVSVFALFTPAAVFAQETADAAAEVDFDASTVIARVNGREITLGHIIVMLSKLPARTQALPDDVLYPGILEQLINQSLLGEKTVQDNRGVPLEVRLAVENERRALLAANTINDIADRPVAEEDVVAAYNERYGDLPAEREFNASHILVDTEQEALELVAELEEGADFAELAREKSTGPSGPSGGSLGWFGLGQMVPEFETAVVALEAGGFSAPVQTQFGWHVIKLNDTRIKTPPTLEETRTEIVPDLQQKAVDDLLAGLRAGATIEQPGLALPPSAMRDRSLLFSE